MDREQEEMQFLGIFGIYKEAYKVIIAWRKIFSKITLALIMPLSFIFLAHMEVTDFLHRKVVHDKMEQHLTRAGSARFNKLTDVISADRTFYWLFNAAYLTFFLVLSLLSTSAVVYTVACVYTGKDVSFKKVMSVVPKVWKRLMVTFLCTFVAYFVYNLVAILVITLWVFLWQILATGGDTKFWVSILYVILGFYVVGHFYLSVIWHLASVVSVLEESCGFAAMIKSQALIKGKMLVTAVIFFVMNISLFLVRMVFWRLVVHGWSLGTGSRVLFGIFCFLLLFKLMLFGLVIQTVIYFVCKSYHHENIDKSALSDHLEVYLGEYVPLKSKDIQLEHYEV